MSPTRGIEWTRRVASIRHALDFQSRDVRLAEERREPVESLDHAMTTPKAAAHRRERDAVLGVDGIDEGVNPDNVQEPGDLANHRCRW